MVAFITYYTKTTLDKIFHISICLLWITLDVAEPVLM